MGTAFDHELEDRFLRYVKIDTTADPTSPTSPSTQIQFGLLNLLLTPLLVFAPVVVVFAQRYQKHSGVGSVVALMLPVAAAVLVTWLSLLILWFVLGIPLGPGYPVRL